MSGRTLWIAVELDDEMWRETSAEGAARSLLGKNPGDEGWDLGEAHLTADGEDGAYQLLFVPKDEVATTRPAGHRMATWPGHRDVEIDTLMHVNQALDQLTDAQRQRNVAYLYDRYGRGDA